MATTKQAGTIVTAENTGMTTSQKFTERVLREYAATAAQAATELTPAQRRIIQGYFVVIDRTLKAAEDERLRKNAKDKDPKWHNDLTYTWDKVNLPALALDAVHYARIGLDMQEKNHLFPIPYANKKGGYYDITLMIGYSGIQYIAEKYALDLPKSVTIELVYSTDVFRPLKKSIRNNIENYDFEITEAFNRGEVVGGFGYIEYAEPSKNTLVLMSRADILKRKPQYASANFWGGKITTYAGGTRTETETPGWFDEMCRKTLIREVYSSKYIPRDPSKLDDDYQHMREKEVVAAQYDIEAEASAPGNMQPLDLPAPASQPKQLNEMPVEAIPAPIPVMAELVPVPAQFRNLDF